MFTVYTILVYDVYKKMKTEILDTLVMSFASAQGLWSRFASSENITPSESFSGRMLGKPEANTW